MPNILVDLEIKIITKTEQVKRIFISLLETLINNYYMTHLYERRTSLSKWSGLNTFHVTTVMMN